MITGKQIELYSTARDELDLAEYLQTDGLAHEADIALARANATILAIRLTTTEGANSQWPI